MPYIAALERGRLSNMAQALLDASQEDLLNALDLHRQKLPDIYTCNTAAGIEDSTVVTSTSRKT